MQLDMVHCGGLDLLDVSITHNLHFAHMYANKNEGQFEVLGLVHIETAIFVINYHLRELQGLP